MSDPTNAEHSGNNPLGRFPLHTLRLRLRKDLQWVPFRDTQRWVLIDPIANTFYYFSGLERALAIALDGASPSSEVLASQMRQSSQAPPSPEWYELFLHKLLRAELLEIPVGMKGAGRSSGLSSDSRRTSPNWRSWLSNPLSIRIPLLRPRIDFAWARVAASCLFAPITIAGVLVGLLVVSLTVLLQVLAHPDQLVYDISKIQGDRWIALAASIMVIKSLHELGHYLACVYLKVRCSEVGVLLLCFTPCLYCDTTDGWKLPSRWQRAGIAAAGVYFESIIAIVGGLLFLYHDHGFLHILGGGMWLMCTVGTLILNANPLFRYDGYFVLSDLLRAPNLATQGTRSLWDGFISLLGGRSLNPQDYDLPLRWLLPFALASLLYRVLIAVGIVTFLWKFLLPLGLGLPFLFLSSVMAMGMLRAGVRNMHSVIAELFAREPISWKRLSALIALLVALGVLAVSWRLPSGSVHRGYVEISGSQPIYASTDGVLTQVHNGDIPLQAGEAILSLTNSELDWSILNAEHEHRLLVERVSVLEQAKSLDESFAAEIPTLEQMASESEAKWKMLEKERQRLSFTAPTQGRFVPKSNWIPAGFNLGEVVREFEPAMAREHVGIGVERGQLLGWFESSTGSPQVVALVPMKTLRYLTPNQSVRLISEAKANVSYSGRITHIGSEPIDVFPEELVDDPSFVLARDEQGKLRSDESLYRVRIKIDQEHFKNESHEPGAGCFTRGSRCSIRFELPSRTLWQRAVDEFRKTFEPSGSNVDR